MTVSKSRPGKGRRARPALLPFGIKHVHKTETPILMAVAAIGTNWFSIDQLGELFLHGDIVRRIGPPEMSRLGLQIVKAVLAIKERYDRTDKIGCSGDEARAIKEAAKITISWLQVQPNTAINKALDDFEHDTTRVAIRQH